MMEQKQHRVPQVYLKEFGFRDGDQWMITTAEKHNAELMRGVGRRWVGAKSIASVTTAENEFDLGDVFPEEKKLLEQFFWNFENEYGSVVKQLDEQKFTDKSLGKLTDFVASLLIRSRLFRSVLAHHLTQPYAHDFLLRW